MYCPNCANATSTDQKFCRSCGLSLEQTSESLREQLLGNPKLNLSRQERALEKFGSVAFTGFGIAVAFGIGVLIYTVLTSMVLSGTRTVFGLFLIAFILFAGLSLGYVFWRESLKEKRESLNPAHQPETDSRPTVRELGDAERFVPVQSVVEQTTDLLLTENKTRKFVRQNDDATS